MMVTYGEMGIEHYGFEALMGKGRERLGKATKFYITLCTIAEKKSIKQNCILVALLNLHTYRHTHHDVSLWKLYIFDKL